MKLKRLLSDAMKKGESPKDTVWCVFAPVEGYFELDGIFDTHTRAKRYLESQTDSVTIDDWKIEAWLVQK